MPKRDEFLPQPDLPLGKYRHYKGGEYEVLTLACDEATHEWLVVYTALYDTGDMPKIWIRAHSSFVEQVDVEDYTISRFTALQ